MGGRSKEGDIEFSAGGETLRAFVAVPEGRSPFPGLVLMPDVRGLSQHFRDVATRFADEGYVTVALDPYSREGAPDLPDMDAVFRWIRALPDRRVLSDIQHAVDYIRASDEVRPDAVAVTGFCMGGQYALMAACRGRGIAACVSWYGMLRYTETNEAKPESPLDVARDLACPYLGLFGEDDALIPPADIDELRGRLGRAGKRFQIVTYAGAGHAFFNDARPDAYRREAASDSWSKAIDFLREHASGGNAASGGRYS